MQQRKCLNQGPTPSHDVVNSSSGTQAVELLTPMDGDPARPMLAGYMDEEEAYHGINTGHFSGIQEKNADSLEKLQIRTDTSFPGEGKLNNCTHTLKTKMNINSSTMVGLFKQSFSCCT